MPSIPRIVGFDFDDDNVEKFASHGLTDRRVSQVLDNEFVVVRNRTGRRSAYLVIGRDHGGACIAVPVEPTRWPGLWRPTTAWPCKYQERAALERGQRHG